MMQPWCKIKNLGYCCQWLQDPNQCVNASEMFACRVRFCNLSPNTKINPDSLQPKQVSSVTPVNTLPSVFPKHTHTHTEVLQVLTELAGDIFSSKFPVRPQGTSRGPTQTYDNKLPPVRASKGKSRAAQPSLIISYRKQPWRSKNNTANRNDFHFMTKNRNRREVLRAAQNSVRMFTVCHMIL